MPAKKLTVHVYDHCPYCIRVMLALGWKGIDHDIRVYGYGDIVHTCAHVYLALICTAK